MTNLKKFCAGNFIHIYLPETARASFVCNQGGRIDAVCKTEIDQSSGRTAVVSSRMFYTKA